MAKSRTGIKLAIDGGRRTIPEGMMKPWPPVNDTDRKLVLASLNAGQHTVGESYRELEKEFAAWNGNKHALFCNSGTAALHMAVVACNCGVGDEIIAPAYTWPSSVTCCLHHNVVPVFVDVEWDSMNIDVRKIEAAITRRTRAIIAVHLHGLPANMDAILAIARKHKLLVIEDCCQAHGATFRGKRVGTMGHAAAFSCNQNKIMCSGEGGFFICDDDAMFERGKTLWYFGESRPPDGSKAFHTYGMGWMYRSSDLVAAFARAQLGRLNDYLAQMQDNAAALADGLEGCPHLIAPAAPGGYGHNWYNYTVRFDMKALGHVKDAAAFRDKIVNALRAEGVDTGVWQGWPVPKMTVFQARNGYGKGCPWSCPQARKSVDYSLAQFQVAQRHCDWHTGMTTPLRPPNGTRLAKKVAEAYRKVLENADQIK